MSMTPRRRNAHINCGLATAALAAVLFVSAVVAAAQELVAATPPGGVPVMYRGVEVFRVYAGYGPLTAEERAQLAEKRLAHLVDDPTIDPRAFALFDTESSTEIRLGERLIGIVTDADAAAAGRPRREYAEWLVRRVTDVVTETRREFSLRSVLKGLVYAALATLLLLGVLWLLARLSRGALARVRDLGARGRLALGFQRLSFITPEQGTAYAVTAVHGARGAATLVLLFAWLESVLASLPWSRPYAAQAVAYLIAPLTYLGRSLLDALPNLFFLVVIAGVTLVVNRIVRFLFRQVELGNIELPNFPAEWADPTYKLVRVLLFAAALVAAYPYIPGSRSPAFQAITLFGGFIVSLSSSSALANVIAGTILTYTRAFWIGDFVRIGETTGAVVVKTLLVTHVRTPKNVVVAIPNSVVLGSQILNYSKLAQAEGVILHTAVTIGYNAPWRTVHALLIAAARATKDILPEPAPFVLQTSLNDFYVTYEINAYTRQPIRMLDIFAELHANIQDRFNEAGVEIMSPHFASLRDGNRIAIPDANVPPGYKAPGFRVRAGDAD